MVRGRPVGSQVRQNMVEILHYVELHGYKVYSVYKAVFPKVTMRAIYYHLKKGVELGEFKITQIKKEKGHYSWGGEVERIYYGLGEKARPSGNKMVKEHLETKGFLVARKQNSG